MFSHMAASCVGREVNRNNATGRRDNFVERVYLVVDLQRVGLGSGQEAHFEAIPDMVTDIVLCNIPIHQMSASGDLGIPHFDDQGTGRDALVQELNTAGILGNKNIWLSPLSGWDKTAHAEFEACYQNNPNDFSIGTYPMMTHFLRLIDALDVFGLVAESSWHADKSADPFINLVDTDSTTDCEAVSMCMGLEFVRLLVDVCESSGNPITIAGHALEGTIVAVPRTGYCSTDVFPGGVNRWDVGKQATGAPSTLAGFWPNYYHTWTSALGHIFTPLTTNTLVIWDNTYGDLPLHDPISELEEMFVVQADNGGFTNRVSRFLVGVSIENYEDSSPINYEGRSVMINDLHCTESLAPVYGSRINRDVYGDVVDRPRSIESLAGWFRNEDRTNNFYASQGYYLGTWPEKLAKPATVNENGVLIPSIQDVLKEVGRILRIPGSDVFNPPMAKQ